MNGSLFFFSVLRPAGVMPDRFLSCRMPARYGAIGGALAGETMFSLSLWAFNQNAGAQKIRAAVHGILSGPKVFPSDFRLRKHVSLPAFVAQLRDILSPNFSFFCVVGKVFAHENLGLPTRLFHRLAEVKIRSKIRVSYPAPALRRCIGFLSLGKLSHCLSHVSN